jgi:hypothetical protein
MSRVKSYRNSKDVSITINKDKITVKGKTNLRTYHCRYIKLWINWNAIGYYTTKWNEKLS